MSSTITPDHREVLYAQSSLTIRPEPLQSVGGALLVTGSGTSNLTTAIYLATDPVLNANDVKQLRIDQNQRLLVNTAPLISTNDSVSAVQSGTWNTGTRVTTTGGTSVSVNASASSVQLLALNTNRSGATFYNDSTANLYLATAATASTTVYKVKIPSQGYYELPKSPIWGGIVSGVWDSATGSVKVTEDS